MFKRANKVTALLIAAASIMSVVPAMAAEKLSNRDGTVKQGVAYEDGQYGYYGYRTDTDDTGIWYNKGGEAKDSAISDLEDYHYDNAAKYGEKYAFAKSDDNNDDEYLVDLSTGKAVDDETPEDLQDTAKSKLQSALKRADRYNGLNDNNTNVDIADTDFNRILTGQFGEVWYQFTTDKAVKYQGTTTAGVVFSDKSGTYIDASYTANMRIYSTKKERAILIEEYNKEYKDAALKVELTNKNAITILAQDKENLYVRVTVTVTDTNAATPIVTTQEFIQKISKAKGSKEDGVNLPKSVTSYQLDTKLIYDNGDAKDAVNNALNTDDGFDAADNLYAVKDDVLYVTRVKAGKVKVFKLKLAKVKVDTMGLTATANKVIKDVDTYLVKKDGDSDHDLTSDNLMTQKADETSKELNSAVSIDTAGSTWALDKGKVYKYTGSEWKQMYSVDRATNSLDVYNDGNLIAWDSTGDVYTTVQEGKKVTVDDGNAIEPNVTTPALVGWKKDATTGAWNFYDVNGAKTANYWANDNGTWYYIKADGVMATGWQQVGTTWYYLNGNGSMATGWVNDNGTWYYLAGSGAMTTGWLSYGGSWYYLYNSGNMASNTVVDGYTLGASGAWVK